MRVEQVAQFAVESNGLNILVSGPVLVCNQLLQPSTVDIGGNSVDHGPRQPQHFAFRDCLARMFRLGRVHF
jgi:hypothetical protein